MAQVPLSLFLELASDREQQIFREWPTHQRNADGHAVGETAGQRERRQAGQIAGWDQLSEAAIGWAWTIGIHRTVQRLRDLWSGTQPRRRNQHVDIVE